MGIYQFLQLSVYTLKPTAQISRHLFRITSFKGPSVRVSYDAYTPCFWFLSGTPQWLFHPLLLFWVVKPCYPFSQWLERSYHSRTFLWHGEILNEEHFTAIMASVAVVLLIFKYITFSSLLKKNLQRNRELRCYKSTNPLNISAKFSEQKVHRCSQRSCRNTCRLVAALRCMTLFF